MLIVLPQRISKSKHKTYKKYIMSVQIMCLANFHGKNKHIDTTGIIKIFDNVFCNYGRERM